MTNRRRIRKDPLRARKKPVALLLAGGRGERLWPITDSKTGTPKPFLPVRGDRTLFDETVSRALPITGGRDGVFVVADPESGTFIRRSRFSRIPASQILLEPMRRDSAAAILLGVFRIALTHGLATPVLVLPTDHLIGGGTLKSFHRDVSKAVRVAVKEDRIVLLGISPTGPSSAYGYIEAEKPGMFGAGTYRVKRFIEKPTVVRAKKLLSGRRAFWNSGMFVARAEVFLAAAALCQPALYRRIRQIARKGFSGPSLRRGYRTLPKVSFDVAIAQRFPNLAMVKATFPWSDVGTWSQWRNMGTGDRLGNLGRGKAVFVESTRNFYQGPKKGPEVVFFGANDLIVVHAGATILVTSRTHAEHLKRLLTSLNR